MLKRTLGRPQMRRVLCPPTGHQLPSAGRCRDGTSLPGIEGASAVGSSEEESGGHTKLTQEVVVLRTRTVVLLSLLLVLSGTSVMAQDSVNNTWVGMTGLVIAPTADSAPQGALIASFNYIDTDPSSLNIWSAIVGLTESFEVGVAHFDNGSSETIGNLKYSVNLSELTGSPTTANLALGVWDLADDLDRAWYLVFSDDFGGQAANARWTVGLADSSGGVLDGIFGGLEFSVAEQGLLQVDYDGDNINAAYRHRISEQLGLGGGIVDGDLALNVTFNAGF